MSNFKYKRCCQGMEMEILAMNGHEPWVSPHTKVNSKCGMDTC